MAPAQRHDVRNSTPSAAGEATVACLGEVILECSVQVDVLPPPDQTLLTPHLTRRLGGPAWNTALHLGSMGTTVRLGGVLGRWDEPMLRSAKLGACVDTHHIAWAEAGSDLLFYFETRGHYNAVYRTCDLPAALSDCWARAAEGCAALVFAGSRHAALRRLFLRVACAHPARWKIFAPNYAVHVYEADELRAFLQLADIVCLNETEARHVALALALDGVDELPAHTRGALLVTYESRGALLHADGRMVSLPALSGREGNVIGAGDAFLAGWTHALVSGVGLFEAARFGSRAAATFVQTGGRDARGQTHVTSGAGLVRG